MTVLSFLVAATLALLGAGCVVLQLIGLPGTWLILLLAVATRAFEVFLPLGTEPMFSWWTLLALLALAVVGEIVELLASAAGAKTGGANKRGMTGAVIGGLLGALLATFLIPIPVLGSILGAIMGSALGAIVGELSEGGRTLRSTAKPAAGAVAGRIAGTVAKTGFAAAMWAWLVVAAFA